MHAFKMNGIPTHSTEVTDLNLATDPSTAATAVPA